jgi:hypothetical protein
MLSQLSCHSALGGGGNQLQRKTAQSGFVLEGVREDYSGSMSVFPCGIRFGRLAAMGPPAKTQEATRR